MSEVINLKKNCEQCCNCLNCDMKEIDTNICVWFFDKTKHHEQETKEVFKIDKELRINLNKFFNYIKDEDHD